MGAGAAAGAVAVAVAVIVALTASSPGSPAAARLAPARTLTDPGGQGVMGLAFTADGKDLAAADSNGTTYLWLLATHKVGSTIRVPGSPSSVAASPDGKYLAIGNNSGVVYQVTKDGGNLIAKRLPGSSPYGYLPPVASTTFSQDSSILAAGDAAGSYHLWQTSTGQVARALSVSIGGGNPALAFSPDGQTLASAGENNDIDLWAAGTGKLATNLNAGASGGSASLTFSPDGKTLIETGSNGHIYLWSMTSGKIIATTAYRLPVTGTAGLAFSPDGRTLAAAGDRGTIYLWKIS